MTYPPGFARAGGVQLPLKERREALREIAEQTQNRDTTQVIVIVTRIVREKWDSVARQPSDITQLSYGRSIVPTFHDPELHQKALGLLVRIPTIPCFASVLDSEEAGVWGLWFAGDQTQAEIGVAIGKEQGTVSKIVDRAVRKVNARYRELRDQDGLPIEIAAWLQQIAPSQHNPDLAAAIVVLQKRDQALRAGRLKDADTGCNDLNKLTLRAA